MGKVPLCIRAIGPAPAPLQGGGKPRPYYTRVWQADRAEGVLFPMFRFRLEATSLVPVLPVQPSCDSAVVGVPRAWFQRR